MKCNTAKDADYMSEKEKEIIYILNLLRTDPKLFAETVVKQYPAFSSQDYLLKVSEYRSLLQMLARQKPLPLLFPDEMNFESAECHATRSGEAGYVGHDRLTKECERKTKYNGECCDYGHDQPLDILMALLIDQHVASLGHRMICLTPYQTIGVSIQPHKQYRSNTVLDFSF